MYHPWDNSTIFYQQDKGGGINPPPMALACGLKDGAAGRHSPPRRIPSLASRSPTTRGKPAFGGDGNVERNLAQPLATRP